MGDNYRDLRQAYPEYHPHALWPEREGLLGFAHDTNGGEYCFRTTGAPHEWTIQSWDKPDKHFKMGFSEFLWEFVHNRIVVAEAFQGEAGDASGAVWTP